MKAFTIAALLATCVCGTSHGLSFDSKNIEVSLAGGGQIFEYQVNLQIGAAQLVSFCPATPGCPTTSTRAGESDKWGQQSNAAREFRQSHGLPFFSRIAISDDGAKYLAADGEPASKKSRQIQIVSSRTNVVISTVVTARRVADIEWVGTEGNFVLLTETDAVSASPRYWIYALSGHPVQFDSFFLEYYDKDGSLIKQIPLREYLKYGAGSFLRRPTK